MSTRRFILLDHSSFKDGTMKNGQIVATPFGDGNIIGYRADDGCYEIELPFGTLYQYYGANSTRSGGCGDTNNELNYNGEEDQEDAADATAFDVNVMYESLEKMRRLNLELACEERGIAFDDQQCTQCLLMDSSFSKSKSEVVPVCEETAAATTNSPVRFRRLRKLQGHVVKAKESIRKSRPKPCLICSAPTCHQHASKSFAKEHITLCLSCEHLFSVDYVVECLTAPTSQDRLYLMDRMMDVYDRTLLLLRYSSQFIDAAAAKLEQSTERTNRVSLGSSSAGVVSGVLGVCAAATILTPAGPPLLVASLLFGGSATAVQTTTDMRHYYSEPNQLADRVIALHGMVRSIVQVARALHDVISRDQLQSGMYDTEENDDQQNFNIAKNKSSERDLKFESRAMVGMTAGRAAAASVEFAAAAASVEFASMAGAGAAGTSMTAVAETAAMNASLVNRSGMVLLRTARVARFAGGALSAATMVLEAKSLNDTLERIRAGNPCEKADILRKIGKDMDRFPVTNELAAEVEYYLGFMARRRRNMSEAEALEALREYEFQKGLENSLLLVTDEEEQEAQLQNDLVNSFLSADPHSGSEVDHQDALPVDTDTSGSRPPTAPVSNSNGQDRQKFTSPLLQGLHRPNWVEARKSVVGARNNLVASVRSGVASLKTQTDKAFQNAATARDIKTTPSGPVQVTQRSHSVAENDDVAERIFDERLTA